LASYLNRSLPTISSDEPYFAQVSILGFDLLVWADRTAWVVDCAGRVIWKATFLRQIRSAIVDEFGFSILAGLLFRFSKFKAKENVKSESEGK
jgi:hypothetical protein